MPSANRKKPQREAEERLAAEQAARAEEDAHLRELYPLPEDEEDYGAEEQTAIDEADAYDEQAQAEATAETASETDADAASGDDTANEEMTEEDTTEEGAGERRSPRPASLCRRELLIAACSGGSSETIDGVLLDQGMGRSAYLCPQESCRGKPAPQTPAESPAMPVPDSVLEVLRERLKPDTESDEANEHWHHHVWRPGHLVRGPTGDLNDQQRQVRIYELSKDLGLDNKDVLDAAEKLSIAAKSHSSSISESEAGKIRSLLKSGGESKAASAPQTCWQSHPVGGESGRHRSSPAKPTQPRPVAEKPVAAPAAPNRATAQKPPARPAAPAKPAAPQAAAPEDSTAEAGGSPATDCSSAAGTEAG